MKLVGICGDIGSGKDTVADWLARHYGFKTVSFADSLKTWVLSLLQPLGVEHRHVFGANPDTKQADQAEPLTMLPNRFACQPGTKLVHWTGRSLLEYLGTEVARGIDPDVWIKHVESKIRYKMTQTRQFESELRFVIADLRFENEFEMVKRLGGEVWRTRLLVEHADDCAAIANWRNACTCGKIRATGHESDMAWRFLPYDRQLAAPKPGVDMLRSLAEANLREMR